MSDEESFVILGTSPMSSLETDGDRVDSGTTASIDSDAPGSRFSSLKTSQLNELQNARRQSNKTTPTPSMMTHSKEIAMSSSKSPSASLIQPESAAEKLVISSTSTMSNSKEGACAVLTPTTTASSSSSSSSASAMQRSAESILWSKPIRPQVEVKEDFLPISLEDCAVQSPLEQSPNNSMQSRPPPSPLNMSLLNHSSSNKENMQPTSTQRMTTSSQQNGQGAAAATTLSGSSSKQNSLASSFIMGEVNADVLKVC